MPLPADETLPRDNPASSSHTAPAPEIEPTAQEVLQKFKALREEARAEDEDEDDDEEEGEGQGENGVAQEGGPIEGTGAEGGGKKKKKKKKGKASKAVQRLKSVPALLQSEKIREESWLD